MTCHIDTHWLIGDFLCDRLNATQWESLSGARPFF